MAFELGRSKSGLPTITENGGSMTSSGLAQIVCGPNGEKVEPLWVPRRGYSNDVHAGFVAKIGMHVIVAGWDRESESASVHRITGVDGDEIKEELVAEFENGDGNIPPEFQNAVDAALSKAQAFHCRSAYYVA